MDKKYLKKLGIHDSWIDDLLPILNSKEMEESIAAILKDANSGKVICPKGENIFKAFSKDKSWLSVVILGQDPYPSKEDACGFSFLIGEDCKSTPYSLQQIVKAYNETYKENYNGSQFSMLFKNFGILWLNTALTVIQGKPESHLHLWKYFTEKVIDILLEDKDIVWMIWGKKALSFVEGKTDRIVFTNHPASVRYGYEFKPDFQKVESLLGNNTFFTLPF